MLASEYFSFDAGTDIKSLLKGSEDALCQAPHWGYMIEDEVNATYRNGKNETPSGDDLFYRPPEHTNQVVGDAGVFLFSSKHEHVSVVDHVAEQLMG